jgi:hypothetical protein
MLKAESTPGAMVRLEGSGQLKNAARDFPTCRKMHRQLGAVICIRFENMFSDFVIESYCSAQEKADVHFMFGRANGNSEEARHLHSDHHPQRRILPHKVFSGPHQRLSASGSFDPSLNTYSYFSGALVSSEMQNSPISQQALLRRHYVDWNFVFN